MPVVRFFPILLSFVACGYTVHAPPLCDEGGECPAGMFCVDGECMPGCQEHENCEAGQVCNEGMCVPLGDACDANTPCEIGNICFNGYCVPGCRSIRDCPEQLWCDPDEGEHGKCVDCLDDEHCTDGRICSTGTCVECESKNDCEKGAICRDGKCVVRCRDDIGRYDASTGLCWQHPKANDYYQWQEANDYCEKLDLGGHSDWHLPSREHFIGLLRGCEKRVTDGSLGYCDSCADSERCAALFGEDNSWYWSSSSYDDHRAWWVRFEDGYVYNAYHQNSAGVRCVRIDLRG